MGILDPLPPALQWNLPHNNGISPRVLNLFVLFNIHGNSRVVRSLVLLNYLFLQLIGIIPLLTTTPIWLKKPNVPLGLLKCWIVGILVLMNLWKNGNLFFLGNSEFPQPPCLLPLDLLLGGNKPSLPSCIFMLRSTSIGPRTVLIL